MRMAMIAALAVTVAGCSGAPNDAGGKVEGNEGDSPVLAETIAADGNPSPGLYRATADDGSILIEELLEDGSYTFRDSEGTLLEAGQWKQKSPEELCFTADAEGADEVCYDEEMGEDGVWRSTDPKSGIVAIIERLQE